MADGVPAAAPAAAPTGAAASKLGTAKPNNPLAPASAPKADAKAAKAPTALNPEAPAADDAGDDWSDKDAAELNRYLKKLSKKDPRARVRVKGEEKGLESVDDLFGIVNDAQRGRGANQVVAEAKKEAAEAKRVLELREAARSGDLEALRELAGDGAFKGLDALRRQQQEEQEFTSKMTDTERMLFERLQQYEQLEQQRGHQEAQTKAEREKAERTQQLEATRGEAQQTAQAVMKALNLPAEKLTVVGPFVAKAMRDAAELGLAIGKDVPPEAILAQAKEDMTAVFASATEGLTPAQRYDFHGREYVEGLVREYLARRNGGGKQAAPQQSTTTRTGAAAPKQEAKMGQPGYLFARNLPR
jgi:hypothetical protein